MPQLNLVILESLIWNCFFYLLFEAGFWFLDEMDDSIGNFSIGVLL